MKTEYQFYVRRKGCHPEEKWVSNPIGSDIVLFWRARGVTPWEKRKVVDNQVPAEVLAAVGVTQ